MASNAFIIKEERLKWGKSGKKKEKERNAEFNILEGGLKFRENLKILELKALKNVRMQ